MTPNRIIRLVDRRRPVRADGEPATYFDVPMSDATWRLNCALIAAELRRQEWYVDADDVHRAGARLLGLTSGVSEE